MSNDLEQQLAAFARALEARSDQTEKYTASPQPPKHRAGLGALAMAGVAVVLLVVLPIVFFKPPEGASPTSTLLTPTTMPPTTWVPTTEPTASVIPGEGWAILGSTGITASDGTVIWAGNGTGRGRLVRDGGGGLVFTDSKGLWWMPGDTTEPHLVAEISGELIEVIPTSAGPVARIGSCPSTFVNLTDGGGAPERLGRINVNCETGDWGQVGRYDLYEDPDGLIWLHIIEFDMTTAWIPVGGPSYPSVRVEDFDGGRVLLSRRQGDLDDPPDDLWLVDLHDVSVVEIPFHRDEHTGAALLGPDDTDLPAPWEPSLEPPHRGDRTDFFDRLPVELRIDVQAEVEADEGTWLLSRPSSELSNLSGAWGCRVPGTDWCTLEYGEVLLLDASGSIVGYVPMPTVPPKWIAVGEEYVYAGAVGDGALPDSTLVRIDRETMEWSVVVFEADEPYEWAMPQEWIVIPMDDPRQALLAQMVRVDPFEGGNAVESVIGPRYVDLAAVDEFIDGVVGG